MIFNPLTGDLEMGGSTLNLGPAFQGLYNTSTSYLQGHVVAGSGQLYICLTANSNQPLTNTTYWQPITQAGPQGPQGPAGTSNSTTIVASENLAAGAFVNIWNNSGSLKVRNADNTSAGKEAHGFVLSVVTTGNTATVLFQGQNTALAGLTLASLYYLGTVGAVTSTPPTGTGQVAQCLGLAISSSIIAVATIGNLGVILA